MSKGQSCRARLELSITPGPRVVMLLSPFAHHALRMRVLVFGCTMALISLGHSTWSFAEGKPKTVGPNACAECHTEELKVWKNTHHHRSFREMPRSKEARRIAKKLKIKRIKADSLCKGCHFTEEPVRNKAKVTAGISCESCHGAGRDWVSVHSEFSGKSSKEAETKAEARARWKQSEARGMIRPKALYTLAKNCLSCHVVPNEKLVNVGGHAAGSAFELVSWSQGEIRHNLWYSKGKSNPTANQNRKRLMYLVGIGVEVETALRAVGLATKSDTYAIEMAHRANRARNKMAIAAKAIPEVSELTNIVRLSHSAGLKLNNKPALSGAADKISLEIKRLAREHDGTKLGAIDHLIPDVNTYKGKPSK